MEHKPSLSDLIESIRDQAFKLPPPPLYQLQPPWGHWHELPTKFNTFTVSNFTPVYGNYK